MRLRVLLLFVFFVTPVFAWNSAGHRVIAQIAYDQLTPAAKKSVDALTEVMFHSPYPEARFLRASTWPDQIKRKTQTYNAWHYVNFPLSPSNTNNVITAISKAEAIVKDPSENNHVRAEYLSFLIHFVGDIHQPMHCVTGSADKGGNLYPINSPISDNLHGLWDQGLGLFYSAPGDYHFRYDQVEALATQWMTQYPSSYFKDRLSLDSPEQWARESNHIATTFSYTLPENASPSDDYLKQGQTLVQAQSVLAGDRLALVLNKLLG